MRMKACRHGAMLYNVNDLYIGRSFDLYGEYAESEMSLLANFVKPGQFVVDVGANIGAHTVFLAQAVGPEGWVLSIEPQRPVFQTLCANVALNALANVLTFHVGASENPGKTTMLLPNYDSEGNFGGVPLISDRGGEEIQLISLDQITVPMLSLIKIDVEGMELAVLKGAAQTIAKNMPILYVENDQPVKSPDLLAHILGMGYRAYWHLAPLYNADNFAGNSENIFGNTLAVNLLCIPAAANLSIEGLREVESADEFPMG
jgi:FkbM family methyltransferase